VSALRAEIAELRRRVAESELSAAALPHRSRYLMLVNGFLYDLLDAHEKLITEVERLGSQRDRDGDRRKGARRQGSRRGR